MKNTWLKKVSMGLALSFALGTAACGSTDNFGDENEFTRDQGEFVEIHNEATGGHLVGDDSFTSVSFDDGTGIACDAGGCIF
jgi:hypothetical protein